MMRRPPQAPNTAASCGSIPAAAGIGLRFQHHREVAEERPAIAWMEVHSENYFGGGTNPAQLDVIRRDLPISLHGVGLSLGGADDLDREHLQRVREAIARFEPGLVSEHLSWSAVNGVYLADLLPLPMTEEALDVVCRHMDQAQTTLARKILIENPSTYVQYTHSTIPEWEFMAEIAARTGCSILCDVNNIFVSASNHGWSAEDYLLGLPASAIGEIHLAGHSVRDLGNGRSIRVDDHGARVSADVWSLYEKALKLFGPVPTLIEWDSNIPSLDVLLGEAATAQNLLDATQSEARHADAA
jgi:uncharacterized protein (UPF0276 family)